MTAVVVRAKDFLQSIGVAAHIDDSSSSYASNNTLAELKYLGVSNLRVQAPYNNLQTYLALGQAGIKFDVISTNTSLGAQITFLKSIAPYVISAEGPNEVNTNPVTYGSLTAAAAAAAYQKDFYAAVHLEPSLVNIAVLPFSLSVGGSLIGYGNVAAYADVGNVHAYASNGVSPGTVLSYGVASVTTTPGLASIVTETGYYTLNDGNSGVTQSVQAKLLIDSLLDNSSSGVLKTYLYELEDGHPDSTGDTEDHYGIYNADGAPKLAALAIHNLTTILADKGATSQTFATTALDVTVDGLNPNYGHQEVFEKSDGSYDVVLWSEPNFYSSATGQESTVTPSNVTVSLGGAYDVSVFDPILGTVTVESLTNVTSIKLSLATDPLILQLIPATVVTTAAAAPFFAPVTLGDGPQSITVSLSEDAWLGDAEFTLSVDGNQVGGTQTVSASHALEQTQAFVLNGIFTTGSHVLTATFLNDGYGGTSTTDRNLYIDSTGSYSQTTTVNKALLWNGPASTTVLVDKTPLAAVSAGNVTLGSGTSSIAVGISEDAWSGNAMFTLSVDGVQIGDVQTATANHADKASQIFTLNGDFTAGAHRVTATFVNDAYGGSSTMDRNLYVDMLTAGNTTTVTNKALLWNASADFSIITQPLAENNLISAATTSDMTTETFISSDNRTSCHGTIETHNAGLCQSVSSIADTTKVEMKNGADLFKLMASTTETTVVDGINAGIDHLNLTSYSLQDPTKNIVEFIGDSTVTVNNGVAMGLLDAVGVGRAMFA